MGEFFAVHPWASVVVCVLWLLVVVVYLLGQTGLLDRG